ncbi:AAA family ATPase [Verrucomicrobiota bacterium]
MKLAISGKGGVGKTTISTLIAHSLHKSSHEVIMIDADPDSNLLACMGYPNPESIRPLVELKDLIEERTGVKPGTTGGMFRINPQVDDLLDKYSIDIDGIKVLVAGAVKKGGSGCYCPENSLVRALVSHLLLEENTTLVLDMEAGIEHISRGTIKTIDRLLVVVEPGRRSVETALRIKRMAGEIGLNQINAIGNRIRSESDRVLLKESLGDIEVIGFVPYADKIREAEINRKPAFEASEAVNQAINEIVKSLL